MKVPLIFICALAALVAGCSWNPDRDNKYDPSSRYYVAPPVRNRPPQARHLYMITDCRARSAGDFCAFEFHGSLSDPDNNIVYDSTRAYLDTIFLGKPAFDPLSGDSGEFVIKRTQDDFPGQALEDFVGDTLWMTVTDDSGATDRAGTVFHAPTQFEPPSVIYPSHFDLDTERTSHPMLVWQPWNGAPALCRHNSACASGCPYSVQIFFRDLYLAWDTVGVCASVDTIYVGDSLSSANIDPTVFYTWYLTATDRNGDRRTSLPGIFRILLPSGLTTDGIERERLEQESVYER